MQRLKLLVLTRYNHLGPSSRVRIMQYVPFLNQHGVELTMAPMFSNRYITHLYLNKGRSFRDVFLAYYRRLFEAVRCKVHDLVLIEKEVFPWIPAWLECLLVLRRCRYVLDYDDAVFHSYDLHRSCLIRQVLGRKIATIMCKSALVIVGNSYLAEYATQAGARRVETLPTVVDLDKFILKADTKSKGFTIGWIGTPNTAKFITMIKPVLITLCSNRDTRLVLVGSGSIELDGVTAEIRTWSEKTEVSDIMSFDVGVMPLYDRPLERGKCGYKLIQYMACSKPVVASPVGVNSEIVLHGVNGFLAASQDEWLDALRRLRMDKDERESLGKAGRRLVEDRYCLQVTAPRLLELLREAAFA